MTSAGSQGQAGQDDRPGQDDRAAGPADAGRQPAARPVPPVPAAPEQSREDTDIAWGDYPRGEDDRDRLYRDRPPHWADY